MSLLAAGRDEGKADARSEDTQIAGIRSAIETLAAADFRVLQRLGWHLKRNEFYCPLNDCEFLEANRDLWTPVDPLEIDWRLDHQLQVAREAGGYADELRDVPRDSSEPGVFAWNNPMWANADALVQYGLLRSRRPRRVIEIGCGWSSLLMSRALRRNEANGGPGTHVTQIEPNPRPELMRSLPSHWIQHASILQRAPISLFKELGDGDILFYDGSHCSRVASDVNWFFFRVLPHLRRGVLIHVHDIILPKECHEEWVFKRGQTWNEQFVLQAFMMHNDAYKVEIANAYLFSKRERELREIYGDVAPPWGSSFWMRKIKDPT